MYRDRMVRQSAKPDAANAVIWLGTMLLALVLGCGSAGYLWTSLHSTADPALLAAAVCGLTLGLSCIAASIAKSLPRAAVLAFAVAIAAGYFVVAPSFIHLG